MKVNRLLAGTLAIVLIAGLGTPAFAEDSGRTHIEDSPVVTTTALSTPTDANPDEIVYENGDPSPGAPGFFIHTFSVAHDFVLENSAAVTDVHFILMEFGGTDFDGEIQYTIFGDSGGPDITNILGSGNGIIVETEFLGTGPFGDRIEVWFDLEDPVSLDAGVTYWLLFHAGIGFTAPPSYVMEDSTGPIGECTRSYPDGNLNNPLINCNFDSWFQITSHQLVGGENLPIDSTALILAGAQSFSWMIPVVLSVLGIGLFVVSRKSE